MLEKGQFISAPGVFDPLSTRIAESCGVKILYMTGSGVSASLLSKPDAGLVSYREMVDRVRSICEVTAKTLIVGGDTGFGGLANVRQAVQGYERAGRRYGKESSNSSRFQGLLKLSYCCENRRKNRTRPG